MLSRTPTDKMLTDKMLTSIALLQYEDLKQSRFKKQGYVQSQYNQKPNCIWSCDLTFKEIQALRFSTK